MDLTPHPLRILHLTAGSDAGGLSRYLIDLCSRLRQKGHEVTIAGQRGAWHDEFERAALPWLDLPIKGGPIAMWRTLSILHDWLHAHPVDLIHTHYRRATIVARRLQHGKAPPPILYTVHLSDLSLAGPRRWLTDFGDHTHVPSDEAREWVIGAGGVPAEQVTLIAHGIDPARFPLADVETKASAKMALGFTRAVPVGAFVGRFDVPKNEQWILDLAERSREKLPRVRFVLLGEGPHEPELRRRIESSRLGDRVKLLPRQDPLRVYEAASALLLPSAREGFSLVCAEAMSVGVPVLRTRTAGTAQLIREGVTGGSVPVEHGAFIDGAIAFLSDPDSLQRMGQAAAEHVRAHFLLDQQVERTLALYARLRTHGVEPGASSTKA
ncbi:MAG TPA: glycosyltransferase family 4 protein [Tepidisphaeraceae bacterium]|nr:glycosyltransferase family 4 protein [Tepidisphaeraceae bacterium]